MSTELTLRMPAEWTPHERTLMEWPVRVSMVHPDRYDPVCADYARIAQAISEFEPVTMIINEAASAQASALCGSGVEFLTIPHNDAWFRDNGPTFLLNRNQQLSAVNWQFNAWGEKYLAFDLDNAVAPKLLEHFQVPYLNSSLILEGGSIHADGEGTLLTTRECLLNPNRNSRLSEAEITAELRRCLNISKIIWLNHGLYGDETDGHVDNVACFAKPGVILMQTCLDPQDPNFALTQENLNILKHSKDAAGRTPEVIQIPQPPARFDEGNRLTLSYLNFYFVNGGVILPVFGGDAMDADETAANILRTVFPDRKVVSVDAASLITEGGNIHCVTQQMPKGIHP
jgi:agmatine deiminase